MKGGFRSNAIDPNARHCMASPVVGFYQTFGIDDQVDVMMILSLLILSLYGVQTWRRCTQSFGQDVQIENLAIQIESRL